MFWPHFLTVVMIVGLFVLAARRRATHLRARAEAAGTVPPPAASPLSQAVIDLVATAGGIYVALQAVAAFTGITIPATTNLDGLTFDPLAVLSLLAAILTPYAQKLFAAEP